MTERQREGDAAYLLGQLDADGYPIARIEVTADPARQPGVAPASILAVIDTGANRSIVSPYVLNRLGIQPTARANANQGEVIMIYPVRFTILATEGSFPPIDVEIGGKVPNTRTVDAIIGNEILQRLTFTYQGQRREFTLSM